MSVANFPGFVNVLGHPRGSGALIASTLAPGVAAGAGAGVISNQTGEEHSIGRDIAVALGAGAAAAAGGGLILAAAGKGPRIGQAFGQNSYQVKVGEHIEMGTCTTNVPDGRGGWRPHVYPCPVVVDDYVTRWAPAEGGLHANKYLGQVTNLDFAKANAAADMTKGKKVAVMQVDGGYQAMRTGTSGVEWVQNLQPTDPRVVAFGGRDGILHDIGTIDTNFVPPPA